MLRKLFSTTLLRCNSSAVVPTSYMSVYPKDFVQPVVSPQMQKDMTESGEIRDLAHVRIRAALGYQTCSVFNDPIATKLINHIMRDGNKELARGLLEKCFLNIKRIQVKRYNTAKTDEERVNIETNPILLLHRAVENTRPLLDLMPIKRGGVTYQVPVPVSEKQSYFLAYKWLLDVAINKERTVHFPEKLAWEVIDAASGTGKAIKRKTDLHKQCEANRAYAHYRWM